MRSTRRHYPDGRLDGRLGRIVPGRRGGDGEVEAARHAVARPVYGGMPVLRRILASFVVAIVFMVIGGWIGFHGDHHAHNPYAPLVYAVTVGGMGFIVGLGAALLVSFTIFRPRRTQR